MTKKHIVMFSGGKDSTAMLLKMQELRMRIDEIINLDSTWEFPAAREHIYRIEKFIGRPITRIEIPMDYYFSEHVKIKGKRKGECGYGWPTCTSRWCAGMKRKYMGEYMRQFTPKETIQYHGIAANEMVRTLKNQKYGNKKIDIRHQLVALGMKESDCLQFCYSRGFDFGGLYRDFNRVSCFCCPLKRISELRTIYKKYPDLWRRMLEMDSKTKSIFKWRKDAKNTYRIIDLQRRFQEEDL